MPKPYVGSLVVDVDSIDPEFHWDEVSFRMEPTLASENGHFISLRMAKAV